MTTVDVVYRFGQNPTEAATLALGRVREVYGIRCLTFDEHDRTIRVEYDSTRLTEAVIHQLLRRAGLDVIERIQLFTTPPPPAAASAA